MKRKVWVWNHYASDTYFDKGGRHYNFVKYLKQSGYEPVVFASNAKHGKAETYFPDAGLWQEHMAEEIGVPFVFVRSRTYEGNGKQRVLNMIDFYRNVKKTAREYAKQYGKPDIIYASSVHPLTLVAGIQTAKHFGVKCICEVRDLWPESIVAYSSRFTKRHPLMRLLYRGEKWIYKKADRVIMTWPGGYDYIRDQGWEKAIPAQKVIHISNGVDLQTVSFDADSVREELTRWPDEKKIFIYAGSVRKVNHLKLLVDAAEELQKRGNDGACILIYGDGDEKEWLEREVREKQLTNIRFMGRVEKKQVPALLRQAYATILHNTSTILDRYGQSQNKFFEYLAVERPILMTYSVGHSVIRERQCGMEVEHQTAGDIADAMEYLCALDAKAYETFCRNSAAASQDFDFRNLTQKLISVIEGV